jgi:hypothetical protein
VVVTETERSESSWHAKKNRREEKLRRGAGETEGNTPKTRGPDSDRGAKP